MFESFIPFAQAFPEGVKRQLGRDLAQAGMGCGAEDYISASLGISLLAAALSLTSIVFLSLEYSALLSMGIFSVAFLIMLRYPMGARCRRAGAIERDLPLALRSIAAELSLGAPFEVCLEDAAKADYGALSAELRTAVRDVRSGMPVPQALSLLSGRAGSEQLDRAAAHLINCYSTGAGTDTLKRVADGIVAEQRAKTKEYNGKFAMYSLFFISASAVVPAVFQALVIVGSSFLDMSITPLQAALVPALGFPALSAAILVVLRSRRPRFL